MKPDLSGPELVITTSHSTIGKSEGSNREAELKKAPSGTRDFISVYLLPADAVVGLEGEMSSFQTS